MPDNNGWDQFWTDYDTSSGQPSSPKASGKDDPWTSFWADQEAAPSETPTDVDQPVTSSFAEQTAGGLITGTGAVAGAVAGFKGGMALPIPHPLLKGAAGVIGGIGGLIAGSMAGEGAGEAVGIPSPEELSEEDRASAYAARVVGESIPFVGAPFAAAARGITVAETGVGKYVNHMINAAKAKPKTLATIEAAGVAGAATGSYAAEKVLPGNVYARTGAEILGGSITSAQGTRTVINIGMTVGRKILRTISPEARKTEAAQKLQEVMEQAGERPEYIVAALNAQRSIDGPEIQVLTTAQKTGSKALAALQKYAADLDPGEAEAITRKSLEAQDAMREMIRLLSATGDPQAFKAAAEMKTIANRELIQSMIDKATDNALRAAGAISDDTPEVRAALSEKARTALDDVIKETRKAEKGLWELVDNTREVDIKNLKAAYKNLETETLQELRGKKLPHLVKQFIERVSKPRKPEESVIVLPDAPARSMDIVGTNMAEVKQLRSELLDQARVATNAGEFNQARIYNDLAESILDDMDAAFSQTVDSTYSDARRFTRELNDTFTRSFVGKATATGKYGDRIAPELLLSKALATGKEAGELRLLELKEATEFLDKREMGTEVTKEAAQTMMQAQEQFIRLMFKKAVDGNTGIVNAKTLRRLIDENELMLNNRFPEVKLELEAAVSSELKRKEILDVAKNETKQLNQEALFVKVAEGNPIDIAQKALVSPEASKKVKEMIDIVNTSELKGVEKEQALKGVAGAIMEGAIRSKMSKDGTLDIMATLNLLGARKVNIETKKPTVLQTLVKGGAISPEHSKQLNEIFGLMSNMIEAKTPGVAIDTKKTKSDAAIEFIARVIGARTASVLAKKTGTPATIQTAGASANMSNYVLAKLPALLTSKVLTRALNDEEFLKVLLQKIDTNEAAELQTRQINAWLLQSGIGQDEDQE